MIVFTGETQIKEPYEIVRIISCDNPAKYHVVILDDAIEPLTKTLGSRSERDHY